MNTEPDLQDLYLQWSRSANTPELNRALLKRIQPWIEQSIIAAGGDPKNKALLAKANMMSLGYLRAYDPKKSTIKNFLYSQLRGLHRVIGNDKNIIKVPERVVLGRKLMTDAETEFVDEFGRYPSSTELANRLGVPIKTIKKWRSAHVPLTENAVNELTENNNYMSSQVIDNSNSDDAWQNYVYDSLPERTRAVMERLYGMNGYKPQKPADIASSLKISQAAVSQHKKKIDELLDSDNTRNELFGTVA